MPLGTIAAQLVHAAGESIDTPIPSGTHAVVLAAKDEQQLLHIANKLRKKKIPHTLIAEPDPPWDGAAMAIGVYPVSDRKKLKRVVSNLPLLSKSQEKIMETNIQKNQQPKWENFPLSDNYYRYTELQKAIAHARLWEQTERLPDLIQAVQEPASKLTRAEKDHAEWVLPYYTDPKQKINLYALSCEIRALAAALACKDDFSKLAVPEDLPEEYQLGEDGKLHKSKFWKEKRHWNRDSYSYRYTQLCALRAALRGKMHFSPNTRKETIEDLDLPVRGENLDFESQREWVDEVADEFTFRALREQAEWEKKLEEHRKKPQPKPKVSWLERFITSLIG